MTGSPQGPEASQGEPGPPQPPAGYYAPASQSGVTNSKSVVAMVLGIAALMVPIPYVLGIIAIVLGNQARAEIASDPAQTGDGFALAGVILGWVDIALSTFMLLVMIFWFSLLFAAF